MLFFEECLNGPAGKSRARFLAQFILSGQSEILRFAQNDSEGLRMTGGGVLAVGMTNNADEGKIW